MSASCERPSMVILLIASVAYHGFSIRLDSLEGFTGQVLTFVYLVGKIDFPELTFRIGVCQMEQLLPRQLSLQSSLTE